MMGREQGLWGGDAKERETRRGERRHMEGREAMAHYLAERCYVEIELVMSIRLPVAQKMTRCAGTVNIGQLPNTCIGQ